QSTWGATTWPPTPPTARSAPGDPWRSSVTRAAVISVRSYAEVAMLHVGARSQLVGGAVPDHAALLQHVMVIRQPSHRVDVLVDQEDRQPALLQARQTRPDLAAHEGRQPLGGLVEDQQRRI